MCIRDRYQRRVHGIDIMKDGFKVENIYRSQPTLDLKQEYKYNEKLKGQIDEINELFPRISKVRGDGNCYYRAVMYQYLSLVIIGGEKTIQAFIDEINSDTSFFEFSDPSEFLPLITKNLRKIKNISSTQGLLAALRYHFQKVVKKREYDLAIVILLRQIVANFLFLNDDIEFDTGLSAEIICGDVAAYIEKEILPEGNIAGDLILMVTPLVLRIQITVVVMNRGEDEKYLVETYSALNSGIDFHNKDGLDWHNRELSVMYFGGHYNALYSKADLKEYPVLELFDTPNLECWICHQKEISGLRLDPKKRLIHYRCLLNQLFDSIKVNKIGDSANFLNETETVSYTHLRAHETSLHLVCRLLLEKKKKQTIQQSYI
eukprot:TRINITY_DN31152_c0_g2_i1.p1 TRINITY_DN31152_c0_g2~~TRINITY_DN31152_c0_g2_i1.p1  ORF type:complete len:375 (-),score=71.12 TRINITY_DN31152_c0_g2_i1:19-1143(-)